MDGECCLCYEHTEYKCAQCKIGLCINCSSYNFCSIRCIYLYTDSCPNKVREYVLENTNLHRYDKENAFHMIYNDQFNMLTGIELENKKWIIWTHKYLQKYLINDVLNIVIKY